ncbi:MAG TPA: lysine--tRNA ligase [Candidatus Bathyarchaeia archaeon]|nr:lysine--tRNA ligase [Candidatus Bathyarchaeia archaeon]
MHWSLAIAQDIVEKRKEKKHVVATGITPSGGIHVGNLREIIIAEAVHTALVDMGVDARLIYIADTFDPLRRRYPFLPLEYEAHVGKPLSEIPDPEGRRSSYADHFVQPFLDSLDDLGIQIEVFRADELYKSGLYVDVIKEALSRKEELSRIIEDVSGRELPEEWTPFNPLCDACGRITAAMVKGYDMEQEEVYYECECGNQSVASFTGGGKLAWRVDWAARWKIIGVTIEPFGKDHASPGGSFDTGTRISEGIYNYQAPYPIPFEHILLKLQQEGTKAKVTAMSSSRGTNIPVHEMLEAVPPEILKHVISRVRPEKHIEFNPSLPLLNLVDEYEREIGGIGSGTAGKIPFRHLITLVQIARGDYSKLLEVIKRSGYAVNEENEEELKAIEKKARYAENWLRTYAPENVKFEVQSAVPTEELKNFSESQKTALKLMRRDLHLRMYTTQGTISAAMFENLSAEDWHNKIYEVASTLNVDVKEVFKAIYIALLGKPSGPRAGWLLGSLDPFFLWERFGEAEKL